MGGVSALMITLSREDAKGFRAEAQRTQSSLRQSGRMSGQHMASGSCCERTLRVERDTSALSAPRREPNPLRVFASSRESNLFFGAAQ